jgi:serine/threonine-protein kinase
MRFEIVPPDAQPIAVGTTDRQFVISPDGTHLVYVAQGDEDAGRLMVRAIDRLEAEPLGGITEARAPFFSPDGKWVGVFTRGELKKVSMAGGPTITLCRLVGAPRGGSWGEDDTIVFATNNDATGLMSVVARGGDPKVLTKPDLTPVDADHWLPSVLPGGRAVLFTVTAPRASDRQVAVLDLESGQPKTLIRGATHAEYVDTGHLVYAAAGTLHAVRFDPVRLEVLGDPVAVVENVGMGAAAAEFSISRTGVLVYMPGRFSDSAPARSLVWVDRRGREEPIEAPPRGYFAHAPLARWHARRAGHP